MTRDEPDREASDTHPADLSRRDFVVVGASAVALGALGGDRVAHAATEESAAPKATANEQSAREITLESIDHAERVAGVSYEPEERAALLRGVRRSAAGYRQRQQLELPDALAPATVFAAIGPDATPDEASVRRIEAAPLPSTPADIAYAPLTVLSTWIREKRLSSVELTNIYLDRLKEHGPKLECVITLTEELALEQAARADRELAADRYLGPLHGIPYGAKDLFDTAGIRTTFGAKPFENRVPENDAAVVRMLREAGAVLIAKTSLGALAYGDIWFGGRTNNPWDLEQGSSGSSAGSAAGTAAGLFGFALGTETLGSIVSPSMRCGTTGLRPTFGRVPRTGAMALCWSLDKVGPICRTVADTALVLEAISGPDPADPSSVNRPFAFDATRDPSTLRVGYDPRWFERRANRFDRQLLEILKSIGVSLTEISLPRLDYSILRKILNVEAAAAFEELTLSNRDDELVWQSPVAWPNSFREARFVPAIELVQADRFRRRVCAVMDDVMRGVDCLAGPSFAGNMLLITNFTGHPSLTLRAGFRDDGRPHGVTLWGRSFGEADLLRLGMAVEREYGVSDRRPKL